MRETREGDTLNRTGIEWCDLTWNPITGCRNGCDFCYARRFAQRLRGRYGYPQDDPFAPTFHPDRLEEPIHGCCGCRIFAVSMGDIFSPGVEREWVLKILDIIRQSYCNKFYILTKRPHAWLGFQPPENLWCGVSIATKEEYPRLHDLMFYLNGSGAEDRLFVSIEPLMGPMDDLDLKGISWVIIGAETGNRKGKVAPKLDWILQILDEADRWDIPVFMKDSLKSVPGIDPFWCREFEDSKKQKIIVRR